MNSITQVIRKVATAVRKTVLIGALVGGVSMIASATETTETKVGPTIGKAQLETVHINLDAVVAAIAKVDPDWVKGLPVISPNSSKEIINNEFYFKTGVNQPEDNWADEDNWTDNPSGFSCEGGTHPCKITVPSGYSDLQSYLSYLENDLNLEYSDLASRPEIEPRSNP